MQTRSARWAPLTGVVFVVLLGAGFVLASGTPSTNATAAKVQTYFLAHKNRMGGAALLTLLSVLVGMFFFAYLRAYFRRDPGAEWLSTLFFGGAIIFAVSGAISAGLEGVAADHPSSLSASSLQLLNALQSNVGYMALAAGLGVMYFAAGFAIRKTGALPGWLAWVSWLLGLLCATFFLAFIAFLATALWVLYVSLTLASRNEPLEAAG